MESLTNRVMVWLVYLLFPLWFCHSFLTGLPTAPPDLADSIRPTQGLFPPPKA